MTIRNVARTLAGVTLVAALAGAGAASAQAQPAAAARPAPSLSGNVAGVCFHNQAQVIQTSAVGRAVQTRLQQLIQQTEGELTPQRNALRTEAQTLNAAKPQPNDPRIAAHQQKTQTFLTLAQQRERELQATEQKVIQRINTESEPVILQVAQQKQCGVVLSRNAAVLINNANDITPQVIAALNAKITTFSFNRETLAAAPAARQ
jgi:Skp family chaperone for outer membrane proteins